MRYSEETKRQARELCAQGLSQKEVGRRLGVSQAMVGRWANPEVAERVREYNRRQYQENPEVAERVRENHRKWRQENPERHRENGRRWNQENSERIRERRRQRYQENPERHSENKRRRYQKNAERYRERARRHYHENPEVAERVRERRRRWSQENPERVREKSAFRRAAKRQATPPWLTKEHRKQMTALHAKARRLEKRTGIQHHVDHIIPLHAKFDGAGEQIACGLHVPWNLQVLSGPENCSKNCRLPDPEHWTA